MCVCVCTHAHTHTHTHTHTHSHSHTHTHTHTHTLHFAARAILAIKNVLELPPSEFLNRNVNFESQ